MEVTTVADDVIVAHDGEQVHRLDGLQPETEYDICGARVRTLPRPQGELLCRLGTVNDVHFGEVEAGRLDEHPEGPIQRVLEGEEPYPETMNRSAVGEMAQVDLAAVIVKGDLTLDGAPEEFEAVEHCYRDAFGE